MTPLTKEQIQRAKEWDLLSYLQTFEPGELKRYGPHEYCTRTHDSLKISNGKWCWNSRGIGGRTALDYLIKVRGMDFVGAVQTLCGYCPPPQPERPAPRPPAPFRLPTASRCPSAVVPYGHSFFLRGCAETGDQREPESHAGKRVRPGAEAARSGAWGGPNQRFGMSKRIFRNIAGLRPPFTASYTRRTGK